MKVLIFILTLGVIGLGTTFDGENSFEVIDGNLRTEEVKSGKNLDISQFKLKNISDNPISLKWKRVSNSLPKSWDYSMCAYGECQIGIPKGAALKVIEPGKEGFIALHIFPKGNAGIGEVKFEVSDVHTGQSEILTFNVTVK